MLLLVRSRRLFLTAIITSTLSRTVKGQVMLLMIALIMKLTSRGTITVSPSMLVIVIAFANEARRSLMCLV